MSDFDLSDDAQLENARQTLDAIKEFALEEEGSDFDPSGTSAHFGHDGGSEIDGSSPSTLPTQSEDTASTDLSNGVQSMTISNGIDTHLEEKSNEFDKLDDDTKTALLQEMFTSASSFTIRHTLKKCNGKWHQAMDELLNHAFLEQDHGQDGEGKVAMKGIDAFSEDNTARRGRKKKSKRFSQLHDDGEPRSTSLPTSSAGSQSNSWNTAKNDIDFLSDRLSIPPKLISSLYHAHGASVSGTIAAILESPAQDSVEVTSDDPIVQVHAYELGRAFPSIPASQLTALIRLTHPSINSAHELASALTAIRPPSGGIRIQANYIPLSRSVSPSPPRHSSTPRHIEPGSAAFHSAAHQQAISQASAAYRRGRSDRLMGQAAGYYSQVGRDHAMASVQATAAAADALVASQSTSSSIDLHGVTVKDAVRIARQKTESWSSARGRRVMGMDGRVRNEGGSGADGGSLRIITGVGRHSDRGIAKIGPAVGRMLMQEGWKFEVGQGSFVVTGRKR